MSTGLVAAVLLTGWLGFAEAGAGDATGAAADADALVKQGIDLRRAGKDDEALKAFKRAQSLRPTPRGRAQAGFAEQALGQWVAAEADVAGALAVSDDPWIARNRQTLEDALKVVRRHIGQLVILGSPEGARVTVDDREVGTLPLAEPLHVATGEVLVKVEAPGHESIARKVTVSAGLARETINLPASAGDNRPVASLGARDTAAAGGDGAAGGSLITVKRDEAGGAGGESAASERPFYARAWFWVAVGVVAAGAGATALVLGSRSPSYPSATMGTFRAN
jgi:hypothetical protein